MSKFGVNIILDVVDSAQKIVVFTLRPDTIYGATFIVLAPKHSMIKDIVTDEQLEEVDRYIIDLDKETNKTSTGNKEKTGVFTGSYAINPINGEELQIWISDYVLHDGLESKIAVPAHNQFDNEFARKFGLNIRLVIEPKFIATSGDSAIKDNLDFIKREAVCVIVHDPKIKKYLCISWKDHPMNGLVTGGIEIGEDQVQSARREVYEETGYRNLKLIKVSNICINSFFYHRQKHQNRWAHFHYIFFELENDKRDPVDPKEEELLEVVWKSRSELEAFFTVIEGKYLINLLDNPDFVFNAEGITVNSGPYSGIDSDLARDKIIADLESKQRILKQVNI